MFMAVQRRVIAASTQSEDVLMTAIKVIPNGMDGIPKQESLMRKLVTLEELSRYGYVGSSDAYWEARFMKNLMRAGGAKEYTNAATRAHTPQKLLALQNYHTQGQTVTMDLIWQAVRTAFVEVNEGEGEDITSMLSCIFPPSARATLAKGRVWWAAPRRPQRARWSTGNDQAR